jgi:hypothetical protein
MNKDCEQCRHEMRVHGPTGCADDDEAAMGGCYCTVVGSPQQYAPIPPLLGPGGTYEITSA